MQDPNRLRALTFCIAAATAACAPTFKAVTAAGQMGQTIDGSAALGAAALICEDGNAISPASARANDCTVQAAESDRWAAVAAAMAAYAAQLSRLAGADDPAPNDQVNAALTAASSAGWNHLTSDQNGAIASFASVAVSTLSAAYREGVLDDVIKKADPPLQDIGKKFGEEIDVRVTQIDALSKAVSQLGATINDLPPAPTLPPPPPPPSAEASESKLEPHPRATKPPALPAPSEPPDRFQAWQRSVHQVLAQWLLDQAAGNQILGESSRAGLALLRQDLAAKKVAYIELKKNVAAFCAAHAKLAQNAGRLDAKELVVSVIAVAKAAVEVVTNMSHG